LRSGSKGRFFSLASLKLPWTQGPCHRRRRSTALSLQGRSPAIAPPLGWPCAFTVVKGVPYPAPEPVVSANARSGICEKYYLV